MKAREAGRSSWIRAAHSIVALSFVVLVGAARAQVPELPKAVLSDMGLPTLAGEVETFYSEGHAARAAYLQEIVAAGNDLLMRPGNLGIDLDLKLAVARPTG